MKKKAKKKKVNRPPVKSDPPPSEDDEQQPVPSEQSAIEYTAEETAEIKEIARDLVDSDKFVTGACIALIASRQIYGAALTDLNARLGELEVKHQDGVRQTLVEAMQDQSMKPFTRSTVLDKIQRHVIPWLVATAQSEDAKEAKAEADRESRMDETRRETTVPIGFPLEQDLPDDPKVITRDRTLALAGHAGAVKYLIRVAGESALKQKEQKGVAKLRVLHLSCYDEAYRNASKRANKDKLHLVLAEDQWLYKCPSEKRFGDFMRGWCKMMRRQGIDLLLIDDMTKLMKPPGSVVTPIQNATQAQRHVRKWADRAGCAVIGGIPLAKKRTLPEIDKTWGTLEVYTNLRRVRVVNGIDDPDYERKTYQIYFDNQALAADLVARKIIDNYKG